MTLASTALMSVATTTNNTSSENPNDSAHSTTQSVTSASSENGFTASSNNNNTANSSNTNSNKPFFSSGVISSINNSSFPLPPPRLSLDMEPNPFEQSFKERESSKSVTPQGIPGSSTGPPTQSSFLQPTANDVSNGEASKPSTITSGAHSGLFSNHQYLTPGGRRILPPMSSIASPSSLLVNAGPGSPGWTDSLRAGPLSPAMLQGPAPQAPNSTTATTHPSATSILSSSLLSLATSSGNVSSSTSVTNVPGIGSTSGSAGPNTLRPGPLSPFIQSSLLGSDPNGLFPTPGPTTAAILNSLGTDLMGPTGLTPLPFKTGITPGGGSSLLPSTTSPMLPAVGSLSQSTGVQMPSLQTTVGTTGMSTSQASSAPASNNFNGSVDAAASLYMMSKGGSKQMSQHQQYPQPTTQTQPPVVTGIKRESPEPDTPATDVNKNTQNSSAAKPIKSPEQPTDQNTSAKPAASATNKRGKGAGRNKRRKGDNIPTSFIAANGTSKETGRTRNQKADSNGKAKAKPKEIESFDLKDEDDEDDDDDSSKEDSTDSGSKKKLTDEEKRKSFLERNRIAALKCRQRKKQWMQNLQAKVEYYTAENENLNTQLASLQEEVLGLRAALIRHKDCSLGLAPDVLSALLAGQPTAAAVQASQPVPGVTAVARPLPGAAVTASSLPQGQPVGAQIQVAGGGASGYAYPQGPGVYPAGNVQAFAPGQPHVPPLTSGPHPMNGVGIIGGTGTAR